jgi:hypothetical protein
LQRRRSTESDSLIESAHAVHINIPTLHVMFTFQPR